MNKKINYRTMKRNLLISLLLLFILTALTGCTKKNKKEEQDSQQDQESNIEQSTKNTTPSSKELTICSLYESPIMKKMIKSYTDKHPDVVIHYRIMSEGVDEPVRNDMIKTLNTELLAGNGPDILILDHLPINSYIEKGALMDMSDIFFDSGIKDTLLPNIAKSFMKENETYAMPIRFTFPYYALREDSVEHMATLDDIAAYSESEDRSFIAPTTYGRLISSFLSYYSHEVVNEDGSINKDGLRSFLSDINTIAQQTESYPGTIREGYYVTSEENYCLQVPDSLMWENGTLVIRNYIKCSLDLIALTAVLRSMGGSYTPMNNSYVPIYIVGITSTTKNPELAKDFIASLFDLSRQSVDMEQGGIPVNEKALLRWKRLNNITGNAVVYLDEEFKRQRIDFDSLTDEEVDQFINYVKGLDNEAYDDDDYWDIFADEGCGYLEGKKTLDQAVDDIINRYNLYQDE